MIYFAVAQLEVDGMWVIFGPWEQIEEVDKKISHLSHDPRYAQVEIARVLTEEDGPDWDDPIHDI